MTTQQPTARPVQPLLLRIEEVARLLGLGRSTVYEMLYKGELPYVKYGSARRISYAALQAWIDAHTEYHD